MKRLLCCIMALTMIGSATAFAAEPVDNSAIAEKALSEVTALYEDLYTITNAEAEVQNSTYDDMGNIIVDVVVSFDRTLKATPEEKEQRNADERAAAEADQLSLRQVESDLRFYFCQVLGDRNIGHKITLSIG